MHHTLITAIYISAIGTNFTSEEKHYNHISNMSMYSNCDLQKSCLEFFDPSSPYSKFIFLHNIVLSIFGIFGICGNILSIIVMSKPEMKCSINCLLIGLAYCDTFVILFAIVIAALGCLLPCTGHFIDFINMLHLPYIYVYTHPLWYTAQVSSIYLTIAITLERYIAVYYPFEAKDICTISRTKRCVYGIILASFIYHLPTYWENGIVKIVHDECNITVTCAYPTDFSKNPVYYAIYWEWMHSIITFLLPFACLIYFNIKIFIQMEKAKKSRRKLTGCTKVEKDKTKILFWIVTIFFMCNSVFPLAYLHQYFFGMEMNMPHMILNQLAMSLFVVNSCVNFLIYILVGKKFKKVLKKMFRGAEDLDKVSTMKTLTSSF